MTGKLLTRLFALFGMTLTCVACYGVEYSEFNPEFGATGRVVDEAGQPIQGIDVEPEGGNKCLTDVNGHFYVHGTMPMMWLRDVDGEANGGEFEDMEIMLGETGSGIELGDIKMKRK
jgi:hypothetical protein